MSWGLMICSACKREVHQGQSGQWPNETLYWYHCDDQKRICENAEAVYPKSKAEIAGKYCGADDCGPGRA